MKDIYMASMTYVMLSRVQSIDQLFILNELAPEKIYPWDVAVEELDRLHNVALNEKALLKQRNSMIISMNIRSLP